MYVSPFPGPGPKRQISSGGAYGPQRWRGKELFYVSAEFQLNAAEVTVSNGTLQVERVQKLFAVLPITGSVDVSADGQKFIVVDKGLPGARPLHWGARRVDEQFHSGGA